MTVENMEHGSFVEHVDSGSVVGAKISIGVLEEDKKNGTFFEKTEDSDLSFYANADIYPVVNYFDEMGLSLMEVLRFLILVVSQNNTHNDIFHLKNKELLSAMCKKDIDTSDMLSMVNHVAEKSDPDVSNNFFSFIRGFIEKKSEFKKELPELFDFVSDYDYATNNTSNHSLPKTEGESFCVDKDDSGLLKEMKLYEGIPLASILSDHDIFPQSSLVNSQNNHKTFQKNSNIALNGYNAQKYIGYSPVVIERYTKRIMTEKVNGRMVLIFGNIRKSNKTFREYPAITKEEK